MQGRTPRQGELRPAGLVDGLGVGGWELAIAERLLHASPELHALYGIAADAAPLALEGWLGLVHGEDRAAAGAALAELLAARRSRHEQRLRIRRGDGEVRRILRRAQLIRSAAGQPLRLAGLDIDLGAAPGEGGDPAPDPGDHGRHEGRQDGGPGLAATGAGRSDPLAEQLRRITDALPALVSHIDGDQRYTFANSAYREVWGLAPSAVIGCHVREVLGEDNYAGVRPYLEAALRGEGLQRYEVDLRLPGTGERRATQVTYVPEQRADGSVAGCTVLVIDLTEQKEAEAALRETRDLLTMATAASGLGWGTWDMATGAAAWDARGREIIGLGAGDDTAEAWLARLHPEDRPRVEAQVRASIAAGRNFELAYRVVRDDGEIRHIYGTGVFERSADGTALRGTGLVRDVTERRRAEAALRESEARFRAMTDAAPMLVWMSGPAKGGIYFNDRWLRFTGRRLEQELGEGWTEGVHPDDLDHCLATYGRAFDRREAYEMEYRLRRADGSYRWIIDRGVPRFDPDGTYLGFIGSCVDIHDRRQAESNAHFLNGLHPLLLRAHDPAEIVRQVLQALARHLDADLMSFGEVTADGEMLVVQQEHQDRRPSVIGSHRLADFLSDEARAALRTGRGVVIADVAADPRTAAQVESFKRYDIAALLNEPLMTDSGPKGLLSALSRRPRRWRQDEVQLLRDVAGRLYAAVERARAEAALRESEERMRLAARAARFGTFAFDIASGSNWWSPEAKALLGLAGDEPVSRELLFALIHPDDRSRVAAKMTAAFDPAGPGEFEDEHRLIGPDGRTVWVLVRARTLFAAGGAYRRPIRAVGALADITERKAAEERQALLMREVDHRAKNALSVVQSVVRLTRADSPADFVAAIEGRIGAIAHAHTLLAETGWQSASLRRLLERELAAHGERVALAGEEVVLEPDAAQPFALAVHELVTNAAKYGALSTAVGRVDIAWQRDPGAGCVRFTWRESGGPPVAAPTRQSFGSVLINSALERQLGGAVQQHWQPEGLVCELAIPLTRVSSARQPHQQQPPPATPSATSRILVVEDETLIALDLEQTLRELGYQVVGPVAQIADALHALEGRAPDAAVLDANLGGESAAPVAARLRALGIPFIIATGYGRLADFGEEAPVLNKPVAARDLDRALASLLADRDG